LDVKQVAIASIAALAIVVTAVVVGPAAGAADPCTPIVNPIACENSKPGTPQSTWDISGAGSSSIQGFATDISVNRGQAVQFKVKTPAKSYRLDIYRMGYYGGMGARQITSINPSAALPQTQPACSNDTTNGLVDCANWKVSASWPVPSTAVSGIYFAKLVRTDGTSGSSHIFFVVRDDSSTSPLLFQTSDTTWEAYNTYGGNSLYTGNPAGRAYKVSYDRPFSTRSGTSEDWVFNSEYPMVRWLESNGYDVSYMAGVDTARNGALIKNHKVFMSVGHDEYWSGDQRANVEAARAAGVNLAFFFGNESFWKTRWEKDSAGANYRTLVCYKETHANAVIDPADPPTWTGTWRDTRFSPPADGGRPENGMTGTLFMVNGDQSRSDSIKVPASFKNLRFWRNTSVARLAAGATKTMPAGTLGYEWDSDLDNGARPAGLIDMSNATYNLSGDLLLDNGSTYGSGPATHNLTLIERPAVRSSSARERFSGRGAWTPTTTVPAPPPIRTCSRRRSTCWRTWPSSRRHCSRVSSVRLSRPTRARRRRPSRARQTGRTPASASRWPYQGRRPTLAVASWQVLRFRPTTAPRGIPRTAPPRGRTRGRRAVQDP